MSFLSLVAYPLDQSLLNFISGANSPSGIRQENLLKIDFEKIEHAFFISSRMTMVEWL